MYFNAMEHSEDMKEQDRLALKREHKAANDEIRRLGIVGVYFCSVRQVYVSRVFHNGKEIALGRFRELFDAELNFIARRDDFLV